jgi:hypothetical protein
VSPCLVEPKNPVPYLYVYRNTLVVLWAENPLNVFYNDLMNLNMSFKTPPISASFSQSPKGISHQPKNFSPQRSQSFSQSRRKESISKFNLHAFKVYLKESS